ncbi:MAG: class I SAM-dependent methyltransferase [SAR202 cluster bacterium]|nr:class I SAM-dependent methyltransferase [SAR202 cluster bacterium]
MPRKSATKTREPAITSEKLDALDLHRVMSMLPIMPYHTVADLACGRGFFTLALAKYVFDGKVYALDADKDALDATKAELDKIRLSNVETVLSKTQKLALNDDSVDGVLVPFIMSGGEDPAKLSKEAHRVLHKGGWMAVLEWEARETPDGPEMGKRVSDADARKAAEKAGFRFTARYHLSDDQYMLLMRK